jgi:hypothetical protein
MTTNEEIREFADSIDPDNIPREGYYTVMAARPTSPTEKVAGPIEGLYHALHVRDTIEEEKGYAGVTFHLEGLELSDEEREVFNEIRYADETSVNGGHYVESEKRDHAEELVERGLVVRLKNPAGVSPIYVPMDSEHYSEDRLQRLREKQT